MEQTIEKKITKIPANPLLLNKRNSAYRKKVAAYCRVSTDEEEQLNSYEAQIDYYTKEIAKNPSWSFAGIYADEGITGTSTKKRKNFLRLMDDCEKGKVDMILTKSISRFARNTVDSLNWVRKLRELNIGVYFEEQAIDSLKTENEMLIGLFSVIAQAESENISSNVKWGIQQSMKNGKFCSNFSCFGYRRGKDGIPEIVPEQAETVKFIYNKYLDGYSIDQIKTELEYNKYDTYREKNIWERKTIRDILKNEKYVGDLLLQKTFRTDCISKKVKVNRGEMPKYLISNNHPAIIEREKFNAVQSEIARRGNKRKKSSLGKTEQGKYSGKYALSEILFCGNCGCSYRRNGKTSEGRRIYYWRCINRTENGKKNCDSVGIEEEMLKTAICKCLNKLFDNKNETMEMLKTNVKYAVCGNSEIGNEFTIENEIKEMEKESEELMLMMNKTGGDTGKYLNEIERKFSQIKILREKSEIIKTSSFSNKDDEIKIKQIISLFEENNLNFDEYDDIIIHRLVECVRVMKDKKIIVTLKGGLEAEEYV